MKSSTSFLLTALTSALLASFSASTFALNLADEDKLKELERAMGGSSGTMAEGEAPAETLTKKKRTRAIVFDSEPQTESTVSTKTASEGSKVSRIQDCKTPPADARVTNVDFAIEFKVGSASIAPSSEDTLKQIAKILSLAPEKCILIEGHSDATGNPDTNMTLSRERATTVYKFIVDKSGMDAGRITAVGKGQSEPAKNLDPRDPKNRRVVFKVVG